MKADVCIIGAGPAGLMAAIAAAGEGVRVVVVERNTTAGRKLLRTGKGRCNFTHDGSVEDVLRGCGRYSRFLKHSFYGFSPQAVRDFFRQRGVEDKVEEDGSVFPVSDRATDVAEALLTECRKLNVVFLYDKRAEMVARHDDGFVVQAGQEAVACGRVIVATGGMSWPQLGSTGDGLKIAESLGHTIHKPSACLVPLVMMESWVGQLAGVGVGCVKLTARLDGERLRTEGLMLFTQDGIGGPAALDMSWRLADALAEGRTVDMAVDLLPRMEDRQVDESLQEACARQPRKDVRSLMMMWWPRSFCETLCRLADVSAGLIGAELPKAKRRKLVHLIKTLPLTIVRARPIEEGTVTRGGVVTEEINPGTMESKVCPGIFFAGEVIDVDGLCGGYNLQIAWSTGRLAGKNAARCQPDKT
ncbi:MAG TPA: NAD(P)/FAD-dependent oxidoreductase [Sedimentisphaerales bacterium]|nr:NAD(P)/FAD-dependent oxidoreductase [Sedimentisphaerales bacterium]